MAVRTVFRHQVLYPGWEMLLLFLASLDVMLTHTILTLGGVEANPLAARVFDQAGTLGMSVYKFALIGLFVLIMEYVGTKQLASGRRLATAGVAISVLPVAVALMMIPELMLVYVAS